LLFQITSARLLPISKSKLSVFEMHFELAPSKDNNPRSDSSNSFFEN